MGRFKTAEEKTRKKMEKNPVRSLSDLKTAATDVEATKKELTPEEIKLKQQGATEERQRILASIFNNKEYMTAEYKVLLKNTGGLVSASMAVAYSRAFNDIIKLVIKETPKDEKSV